MILLKQFFANREVLSALKEVMPMVKSKKNKADGINKIDWKKDDFYRCKECDVTAVVHRQNEGRVRCPKCGAETEFNVLRYFNIKR